MPNDTTDAKPLRPTMYHGHPLRYLHLHDECDYVGAFWTGGYDTADTWTAVQSGRDMPKAHGGDPVVVDAWTWNDLLQEYECPDAVILMCGEDIVYLHCNLCDELNNHDTIPALVVQPHRLNTFIAQMMLTNNFTDTREDKDEDDSDI